MALVSLGGAAVGGAGLVGGVSCNGTQQYYYTVESEHQSRLIMHVCM